MYELTHIYIQQRALAVFAPFLKHVPSSLHPLYWLAVVEGLIGANFLLLIYFGEGLKHRALRGALLLASAPVALSLVPLAIGELTKACCVQVRGAGPAMRGRQEFSERSDERSERLAGAIWGPGSGCAESSAARS